MAQRKGWNSLSAAYQKRLSSNGITPAAYAAGASIKSARGHATTPERPNYIDNAFANDIEVFFPDFTELPRKEQLHLGRAYERSLFTKGRGTKLTDFEKSRLAKGQHTERHRSDQQVRDLMDLIDAYREGGYGDEGEFWREARAYYQGSFSAAA